MMSTIKSREWYWVPHPSRVWIAVMVQAISKNKCWVTTVEDDQGFELDITECPFLPLNPRTVDDMTSLLYLHEAGILENLYERSKPQNQHPYTYVSNVLIAINPLRDVPSLPMEMYKDRPIGSSDPHPYGIAELAYQQMTLQSTKIKNQSIVISGESGAGKTETAKIVLRYMCWRASGGSRRESGYAIPTGNKKTKDFSHSLDRRLLDTNPILEAFGNAKTLRNSNSSRFGKLFKLHFDPSKGHQLVSASMDTYLLEKSRVTCFSDGERNYHCFYQLLAGASAVERKKWQLKEANQYHYINQSSERAIPDVDDKALFGLLNAALLSVGIAPAEQDIIYRILSAILTLGNTTFRETEVASGEAVEISEPYIIAKAAEMLGVRKEMLESIITSRTLDMVTTARRASSYRIPLDITQAMYARDAVAKAVYKMVFDWIVSRIASALQPEGVHSEPLPCIGVLDIFGFESFVENGLEQLLINYANESLQLTFNQAVLLAEQQLYLDEGLQIGIVEFVDNSSCVELIAGSRNSILNTLDSVCKAPKPTEEKFNTHLHQTHADNVAFPKVAMVYKRESFLVKHYAKTVMYTVGTFIPKNMDTTPNELLAVLASSVHCQKCSILSAAGIDDTSVEEAQHHIDRTSVTFESQGNPLIGCHSTTSTPPAPPTNAEPDSTAAAAAGSGGDEYFSADMKRKMQNYATHTPAVPTYPRPRKPVINRKSRNETVSSTFVRQMASLCSHLESTNCTFIRCIKPNHAMSPGLFEHQFVMEQVRVLGIIQTCEVLKQGMPTRLSFTEIGNMYRSKFPPRARDMIQKLSPAEFTIAVANALDIPSTTFHLGRTRVFFTSSNLTAMDKLASVDMTSEEGDRLVASVVSYHIRQLWKRALTMVYSQVIFCLHLRSCRRKHEAVRVLQSCWRAYACSSQYKQRLRRRKLWKRSIYYTIASNVLLENYFLIRDANEVRQRAEAAAEESLRLIRERESEMNSRRRARTASGSGAMLQMLCSDAAGLALQTVPEATDDDEYGGGSEVDFILEQDAIRAKAEIRALAAASSLATVSVCLFRWTKIRLFMAFEKWHETCIMDAENGAFMRTAPRARVMDMLERTRVGPDQRDYYDDGSVGDDDEICSRNTTGTAHIEMARASSAIKCFECQDRLAQTWCDNCYQGYCPVCSQFVHNSCRMMKLHAIQHISKSPQLQHNLPTNWPGHLSGYAVAETMREVVCAVEFDGCEAMLPGSARLLYFSKRSNNGYRAGDVRVDKNTHGGPSQEASFSRPGDAEYEDGTRARRGTVSGTNPSKGRGGMGFHRMGSKDSFDRTKNACAIKSCHKEACKGISIRFCEEHYDEFRRAMRSGFGDDDDDDDSDSVQCTLQQQVALLKKQLQDSGQEPVEFVELSVARERMQSAVQRLMSGDESAEKDIERWDKAIRMNPDYQRELEEKAAKWEADQREKNLECLRRIRELVPPDIRHTSVNKMVGEGLPKQIATRVWTKKALWCTRMHPDDIKKIHIADLRTKFGNQGLDIIEMRAIYSSLPLVFDNDGDGKKAEWRSFFRQKLEELTAKEASNRLTNPEKRNTAYKGHDELRVYDPDAAIEVSQVQKSAAFDATEMSDLMALGAGDGGGVKRLQADFMHQHTSDSDDKGLGGSRPVGKLKAGLWESASSGNDSKTSKSIAAAAAAQEEQDRAIARGSYIVPTANPLLDRLKKQGYGQQHHQHPARDDDASTNMRATMTIQQTLQHVQQLTRQHAPRDEGRDNAARLANAGIYNSAKGALQLHSKKRAGHGPGHGAVRRHASPLRGDGATSPPLPVIQEKDDATVEDA